MRESENVLSEAFAHIQEPTMSCGGGCRKQRMLLVRALKISGLLGYLTMSGKQIRRYIPISMLDVKFASTLKQPTVINSPSA